MSRKSIFDAEFMNKVFTSTTKSEAMGLLVSKLDKAVEDGELKKAESYAIKVKGERTGNLTALQTYIFNSSQKFSGFGVIR